MRWLNAESVADKLATSVSSVYKMVKHEGLPPPMKRGSRSFWNEDEIDRWMVAWEQDYREAQQCRTKQD